MSGEGRPDLTALAAGDLRIAVAAARWHTTITGTMVQRALAAAADADAAEPTVARVPGCVELPVVCQQLARDHDLVVALGVVVRGGTPHFEYVCDAVTQGLTRVALDASVPVGNGVLTCETEEQALARCGLADAVEDKGYEACVAALETASTLRDLRRNAR